MLQFEENKDPRDPGGPQHVHDDGCAGQDARRVQRCAPPQLWRQLLQPRHRALTSAQTRQLHQEHPARLSTTSRYRLESWKLIDIIIIRPNVDKWLIRFYLLRQKLGLKNGPFLPSLRNVMGGKQTQSGREENRSLRGEVCQTEEDKVLNIY